MTRKTFPEYARLLERYHGTLDLVSAKGLQDLDRLIEEARAYSAVVSDLAGETPVVVDLGSGAGLPGIVVAAELPGATVHLVERRRRRGAFLEMVAARLELGNALVHTTDISRLSEVCADAVTAQAVSSFAAVSRLTRHLHRDPCFLISRKSADWDEEFRDLSEWLSASAEDGSAVAVADERPLGHDGSLVALRLVGGRACPPSG